jgi:hypothetical protein
MKRIDFGVVMGEILWGNGVCPSARAGKRLPADNSYRTVRVDGSEL